MLGRVLVAGFATRHVVQSARRAGYAVYAIDHFCDQDLGWYAQECVKFQELDEIGEKVAEMARLHSIDILVVTSGAEEIAAPVPLYGTPPRQVERYLDKLEIQRFLEENRFPAPPLAAAGEYPAMLKPRRGAGGWRNQMVRNTEEEARWREVFGDHPYIAQRMVSGTAASVSCLADGSRARAVAANRQLLRGEGERQFGFSGSLTPLPNHPLSARMIRLAEEIAGASGCIGSIGVDFVLGEDAFAIEINPRFQATLDTVEMATGLNLFRLHMDACRGRLPERMPAPSRFAVRRILFSERDRTIRADLAPLSPRVADIPWPGTDVEEGQAIISLYGWGETPEAAFGMLDRTTDQVRRLLQ
ncbi:MAG: ATP-grasp domain-containing protein [Methanomicrobiales archaeon]|nr:ATP-grasp domain-containing protein [Methanomicrobiales archaeon]MDI6877208.1 ATP-grasp domain-containing protein [Methanomicrobiales archaeon]